ncbi:MAG: hypothetical protein IRZ11_02430 [Clostridia bacterium]|nr:hypothetical protein [Clostridia bacterium]
MSRRRATRGAALVAVLVVLWSPFVSAQPARSEAAPTASELALSELDRAETGDLRRAMAGVRAEAPPYVPLPDWADVRGFVAGRGFAFDARAFLLGLFRYLAGEAARSFATLAGLLALAVLASLLTALRAGAEDAGPARLAEAVTLLVQAGLALAAFLPAIDLARTAVYDLRDLLLASLPLFVTLVAGSGGVTTAGLLHPLVLTAADLVALLAADVAFPLLFVGVVLELASLFSAPFGAFGAARLLRQAALALVALALTAYLGLVTVLGAAGAVADGVALRAAKFAAATFVPVIGKTLADAADLVAGASLLVRSGVGVATLVLVLAAALFPLVKLVALVAAFRAGAALVEPIGAVGATRLLSAMGDGVAQASLVVAAVGLMTFLSISALLVAGVGVTALR